MDWDIIQGHWKEAAVKAKEHWGVLTQHDVDVIAEPYSDTMGHAGAVVMHEDRTFEGAHDPRADAGAFGV